MAGHKQACGWVLIALQIRLIDSPTERTTAATDALLALFALSSLFYLNYVISLLGLWPVSPPRHTGVNKLKKAETN